MAGIDSLVNSRADMFAANPQGLQQRYAMNQDLLDLLALQKLKKDKEAAQRSLQMQMQPESGTVKDQLEGQMMQATKQELAASLAPGIQQQGQQMAAQQAQQAMGGVASQPAPNMVGMAQGGIVGYQEGGGPVSERRPSGYEIRQRQKAAKRERAGRLIEALGGAPSAGGGTGRVTYMGTGDRDVRSVRTMPESTEQQPRRSAYDIRQEEKRRGRARIPGTPEAYVALMENPPPMSALEEATRMGLIPPAQAGGASPAQATQSTTPAAGIESLVAPRSAPSSGAVVRAPADRRSAEEAAMQATRYQATDEDLRSMRGEDVAPMQRAAPTAPTDPRMSRYEDQYDRLVAEEKDKLGALIDFLLAAGASGGTNLGATLMGGGSGLQAREQRIQDEMAQTVKNIEDLQFQRDEMQARREETAEDRALRLQLEQMGIASAEKLAAEDIASRENVAQLNRNADIAIREAANASALTQEQQANLRALYNAYRELATEAREAANELGRDGPEKAKSLLEYEGFMERLRALEGLIDIPVAGGAATVGGDGWGIER